MIDLNAEIPKISIILRTKNEERFIGQTLSAVFEQEARDSFEVVVIDSGSTDRTLEIVQQFKTRLCEIEPSQFTFGYTLNHGAALARGEYIVNLSAHCVPLDSQWMGNLLGPLWSDPSIVATYGKQVPIEGLNPFEERMLICEYSQNGDGNIRTIFSNSNCAIRKSIWEKFPFDERAPFGEDFIWAHVLPTEYKIKYVPAAAVSHSHPLTFSYWAKRYYDNGLLDQYMAHSYGLQYYPWQVPNYRGKHIIVKKIFEWIPFLRTAQVECFDIIPFLLRCRYFRYLPIFPIYFMIKHFNYHKGIKEGRRLYGSTRGQA